MINYEKRIKDRLNALNSQLAELRTPKLTKERDNIKELILIEKIHELQKLLK